jgi:Icc-related predicted phosphoesterase
MIYNDYSKFIDTNQENILVHSGDCTNVGKENEIIDFVTWFEKIKGFTKKIFIAGNHDFGFENYKGVRHHYEAPWLHNILDEEKLSESNVIYLHDSEYIFDSSELKKSIKFYGSPWQPEFFNWAFNLPRNGVELKKKWDEIPVDTDILITHGPPHMLRDFVPKYNVMRHVGCELLYDRVIKIKPLVHVFGHIHYAHGVELFNDTFYVNASICTEGYNPINSPIVIDLINKDGKIIADYVVM